jgi:hypothetical protein
MKKSLQGRLPVKKDERNFKIGTYLKHANIQLPKQWNWDEAIGKDEWGVMYNSKACNCTIATAGHLIMAWTASNGKLVKPSDEAIIHTYAAMSGYNIETDENDTGLNSLDVLKYWRKYYIHGHKIFAYADIDWKNHEEVKQAIYLFGGCFAGLNLPSNCEEQHRWELPESGATGEFAIGSWGGHAIMISGYNEKGLKAITWGVEKWMSWEYWDTYCDEAYAVLSDSFIKDNKNPAGIDVSALRDAITSLKNS